MPIGLCEQNHCEKSAYIRNDQPSQAVLIRKAVTQLDGSVHTEGKVRVSHPAPPSADPPLDTFSLGYDMYKNERPFKLVHKEQAFKVFLITREPFNSHCEEECKTFRKEAEKRQKGAKCYL